jgi:uncharacterized protein
MTIRDLSPMECRAVLERAAVGRLACARDNQPYIVPIHIDLDGDFLYGYATVGRKIEWMRANPLVCVEVDAVQDDEHWTSVVVLGEYEELPRQPEYDDARRVAERLFQRHPMWWEPASVPVSGRPRREPVVFRIRIGELTGRRAEG